MAFVPAIEMAEMGIPLLEEGALATGRVLSRAGGSLARTAAGRAIAAEARAAARQFASRGLRRAAIRRFGVPRGFGAQLAEDVGGVGRAGIRALGRAYRTARANPLTTLGSANAMYGMYRTGRKLMSRPLKPKKKKPRTSNKKRKRLIPTVYRSTKPRLFVADRAKRFRKGLVPRKYTKAVRRNFDDYGTVTKTHGLWMGFQHHGSTERMYDMLGEALLKAILACAKLHPTSYDEPVVPDTTGGGDHILWNINIEYKRINGITGDEEYRNTDYAVFDGLGAPRTFKDLSAEIGLGIQNNQQGSTAATPATDTVGYFPYRFTLSRKGDSNAVIPFVHQRGLDDAKITLVALQKIRLQNVTPNDDATAALDQNGTNPLNGKYYQFVGAPRVRSEVLQTYDSTYAVGELQQHYRTNASGVMVMPDQVADSPISHPPPARQLFDNCRKTAMVSIGAGGQKFLNTTFKFTGTFEQFAKKHGYSGFDRVTIGGCTWFGFEQAFRQGNDTIKIGFNRELHMTSFVQLKPPKVMLSHYDQTDLGDSL